MSLLALAAMLLLLLVPTVGRVLSARSDASDGVWTQMCTMAGLKLVKLTPGDANPVGPDPAKPSPAGNGMADDCAYCPVLNALVALVLWAVFAFPAAPTRQLPPARAPLPRTRWHPSGLGSRGPPIAL
jgi:hypothetical protein